MLNSEDKLKFDSQTMWDWAPDEDAWFLDSRFDAVNFESSGNLIRMKRPSKVNYFDKGFVTQLAAFAHRTLSDVVVINDFLSVIQIKNIKRELNSFENINHESVLDDPHGFSVLPLRRSVEIVVLDRLGLILEIFNRRCNDELMKIQIAMVYLNYAKVLLIREGDTFSAVKDIMNFNIFRQIGSIEAVQTEGGD